MKGRGARHVRKKKVENGKGEEVNKDKSERQVTRKRKVRKERKQRKEKR
jgi:hypothetical protein